MCSTAFRVVAAHRPGSAAVIDRATGLALITEANLRKTTDWELLLLMADEPTVAVGRRWRDAILVIERLTRSETWLGEARWTAAVDEVDHPRGAFYREARRSIGVLGGSVSQFAALRAGRSQAASSQASQE